MAYKVTFTYIVNPDSHDMLTGTREFATKQEAWDYVKALDRHSKSKLTSWSEANLVECPDVPGSQPLKSVTVFAGSKQVFGWHCPSTNECWVASLAGKKVQGFFIEK